MATGTSFKQQCPSCEAMVPIRDPGLIGRKIDCPKCKYRFVVEEPADIDEEEDEAPAPKKKGDNKVTTKPAAKGAVKSGKGAGKAGPRRKSSGDEEPAVKKKAGSSMMLIGGGVLALVAVVGIAVGAFFLMSGDDNKKSAGTTPIAPVTTPELEKAANNEDGKAAAPTLLTNVSNLLPNDTQMVISYPMDTALGSSLKAAAIDEADGGFKPERFRVRMGFALDEVNRIINALSVKDDWVFTILQTKTPFKAETIKKQLRLAAQKPVQSKAGKSYDVFQIDGELDSLGNLFLKCNKTRDRFHVHFLDANTMVFADPGVMQKFLEGDAKPEFLTKENADEKPATPPTTPGPPGVMIGGGLMMGGATPPIPGGMMMGSPTGPGTTPPTSGMIGGGAAGGPGGMPGMPGMPGSTPAPTPAPVEAAPANYMSIDTSLKALIERIEKMKEKKNTQRKEAVSVVTIAFQVAPLQTTIMPWLDKQLAEVNVSPLKRLLFLAPITLNLKNAKVAGGSVAVFDRQEASVSLAVELITRKEAETREKELRDALPLAVPLIKSALGLAVTIAAPTTPKPESGMIPGMTPGMPGMRPPMTPGSSPMPGMTPIPGSTIPGMNPGTTPTPKDEKDDGGTLTVSLNDRLLVGTLDLHLTTEAHDKIFAVSRERLLFVKSLADMATARPRYYALAGGLQAYLEEKGEFPRGTAPRGNNPETGLPYRPDQRLSFFAALLPYLGDEYREWKIEPTMNWTDEKNLEIAARILPPVLAHRLPNLNPARINYPGLDSTAVGATHFVGVAGLGMDAANYLPSNPKAGVFGYDRATKMSEVKDGLANTIALLLVPADHMTPWMAGGGATVRAVADTDEDLNPLASFVCIDFPSKQGEASQFDGNRGTLAIMADGKVRFIPASLPAATFRALCTIAGGEKIERLDKLCPVIENDAPPELKAEPLPVVPGKPPVAPAPAGLSGDLKNLQGNWQAIESMENGKAEDAVETKKMMWVFRDNKLTMPMKPGVIVTVDVRLLPTTSPKSIDLIIEQVVQGKKIQLQLSGIYELMGDSFHIAVTESPLPRPAKFESTPANKVKLALFKRMK